MEPLPPSEPVVRAVHKLTLLERLQGGGLTVWVILFLALLLFALFVTCLAGRRTYGSIIGYFATALLPVMAGLCGVAVNATVALENLATAGVGDPAQLADALGRIVIALYLGAGVTFLALIGTIILALVGPSNVVTPPPVPQ